METAEKRGKGRAATYRRYPSGEHGVYDQTYNSYRVRSSILNEGMRSVFDVGRFDSIQSIENELYLMVGLGDKTGSIKVGKTDTLAHIPKLQKRLRKLKEKHNKRKESMLLSGYDPSEIFETRELKDERLETEAKLDVRMAELEWLNKKLAAYTEKKEEEDASKLLMNGPEFTRKGSPPKEVDGQTVGSIIDDKGNRILIINDSRSPYNGMSLTDYKQLCKKWMLERVNARAELAAAQKQEIMDKGSSSIQVPLAGSRPKRDTFPVWPDAIKNHLED